MKRSWSVLAGIFTLLAIATFFVLRQPGEQSVSTSAGEPLVKYDSASVDRIEIRSGNGAATFAKEAGKWMMTSPVRYAADGAAVTAAVGKGRDMKLTSLVSTNPAKQNIYSVDSTGTLVQMFANNARVASFRVGKPSSSYTETYVRNEGSNDVYLTEGVVSATFVKATSDWRDKTIFKTEQSRMSVVKFQLGDTTFSLTKKDSLSWVIGSDSTINSNVTGFLGSLADYQADGFVDTAITVMPKLTCAIETQGTQIRFFKRADGTYYVQSSASTQWFAVQEWKAAQVVKRKKDFVPAPPARK